MKLEFVTPITELKPYISKIWVFESNNGLLNHGTLIAPNAKAKIIIPYKNSLTSTDNVKTAVCKENNICFIGIRDAPVTLGNPPGATGSIGIELTTAGSYKFLNVPMHHLTNNLFVFGDLFGKAGKELQQQVMNDESPEQKVTRLQLFLLWQLRKTNRFNSIVDFSINHISASNGLMEMKELERKTGYSKRYLDMLFKSHLGISPKTYATILRFRGFYKFLSGANAINSVKDSIYELYYDQSHFIKEFKHYTGYSPIQYSKLNNDFGKNF